MNHLDMSAVAANVFIPIGGWINATTSSSTERPFSGTFDGNGKKIRNLSITRNASGAAVGLFGHTSGATIKNLGIENGNITTTNASYIGGLVGSAVGGTITNCSFSGTVSGSGATYVGGLAGSSGAITTSCYTTGVVTYGTNTGGLFGIGSNIISNCFSTCTMTGSATANAYLGGLIGRTYSSLTSIFNCYAAPTAFTRNTNASARNGLFIGNYEEYAGGPLGEVINCYYSNRLEAGNLPAYMGTGTITTGQLIGKTDTELKEAATATLLNAGQTPQAWRADFTPNVNGGFPILS